MIITEKQLQQMFSSLTMLSSIEDTSFNDQGIKECCQLLADIIKQQSDKLMDITE